MGEKWIDFVKRIHTEGVKKNPDYSFKQAMVDAGKRKSEWKKDSSSSITSTSTKTKKNVKKMSKRTKRKRAGRKSIKN